MSSTNTSLTLGTFLAHHSCCSDAAFSAIFWCLEALPVPSEDESSIQVQVAGLTGFS